jgi:hypothetical protein
MTRYPNPEYLRAGVLALALVIGIDALTPPADAAGGKFFAYNMTTRTDFKGVYLAPAGTQNWGPNQALNDPDKSLDTTERLTLTGLTAGNYDVKLVDENGRTCIVKNVDLTKQNSFEIIEGGLADCH